MESDKEKQIVIDKLLENGLQIWEWFSEKNDIFVIEIENNRNYLNYREE